MIKYFLRVVFLVAAIALVYLILKYQPKISFPIGEDRTATVSAQVDGLSIWHDRIGTYSLVIFDTALELLPTPDVSTPLSEILETEQAKLVTNAGYYYFDNNQLYYSGLIMVNGQIASRLNTLNTTQVSHVVFWNREKLTVLAADAARTQVAGWEAGGFSAFQSGPLLIKDNQTQTALIQKAENASGRYLRTVLGQLLSGEKFIWIQKVPLTLPQLTENLQDHEQLKGKIDFALNLDGGSSTSIVVDNYETVNFFPDKLLPSVLLVK